MAGGRVTIAPSRCRHDCDRRRSSPPGVRCCVQDTGVGSSADLSVHRFPYPGTPAEVYICCGPEKPAADGRCGSINPYGVHPPVRIPVDVVSLTGMSAATPSTASGASTIPPATDDDLAAGTVVNCIGRDHSAHLPRVDAMTRVSILSTVDRECGASLRRDDTPGRQRSMRRAVLPLVTHRSPPR